MFLKIAQSSEILAVVSTISRSRQDVTNKQENVAQPQPFYGWQYSSYQHRPYRQYEEVENSQFFQPQPQLVNNNSTTMDNNENDQNNHQNGQFYEFDRFDRRNPLFTRSERVGVGVKPPYLNNAGPPSYQHALALQKLRNSMR